MSLDNNNILGRLTLIPLPSAPDVLLRLLSSLTKEGTTFDEIAQIIRDDVALCAKVLDIAYPAYVRAPRRLVSLQQALADVGVDALKTLVFSTAVNQVFHQPAETAENMLTQESATGFFAPIWRARLPSKSIIPVATRRIWRGFSTISANLPWQLISHRAMKRHIPMRPSLPPRASRARPV